MKNYQKSKFIIVLSSDTKLYIHFNFYFQEIIINLYLFSKDRNFLHAFTMQTELKSFFDPKIINLKPVYSKNF